MDKHHSLVLAPHNQSNVVPNKNVIYIVIFLLIDLKELTHLLQMTFRETSSFQIDGTFQNGMHNQQHDIALK